MKRLMRFSVLAINCLIISILNPSPLLPQSYRTLRAELEQIEQSARWRFGPFKIDPSIQFRNIGYDSNIYQIRDDESPLGDFTASVSVPLNIYLPFRDWMVFYLSLRPQYVYYLNEKQQRGLNFNYSPGVRFLFLGRFVLSGNYQYQRQRRRASIEFDDRIYVETRGYNASIFYETSRMTTFGFSGRVRDMSYEDLIPQQREITYSSALNREERSGYFEIYYRILRESDFFLTTGYTEYKFKDTESQWRNSYSYEVITGIRFPFLGRARGTLSLGYRWLISEKDENLRFSGPVGNTGLNFRLGRVNLRFQVIRDFRFSYSTTNLHFIENQFGAGVSFYVTQFIRIDYDFSYGKGAYSDKEIVQLPGGGSEEVKRSDTYLSHSAGLVFRLVKNTGIGLTVNFWKRDSNVVEAGRTRTFIGGYLTYDF